MTDDLAAEGDRLHACRSDFWAWAYNNWPAIAAALRERDEAHEALHDVISERDAWHARCYAEQGDWWDQFDALRALLATAEADADQLAQELDKHGHGDFHYTPAGWRDQSVLDALAAHAAAVEARP